ncbi:radical SAM protein [Actinomadura latina]|uniref:Radical SAM protein n=1 Tax=Actinomadura latina TaxID=163603 RepID=A0A846YXX6_9ACTN|nr:radical SAM protein [Actinomadura latina]NKZ03434.1 radical SAM protein [Actinomadura latina]
MPDVRYSVILGSLQASAQDDPVVAGTYRFHKHMIFQDPGLMARLPDWVAGLERPDVVALPVYFWNRAPVMLIAREVKRRWPDCTVVLGGNDVSHQTERVFAEEAVDVLVHGEGEITFRRLLASGPATGALDEIPGISYRRSGRVVTTAAAERITDLSCLPSPLLSGVYSDEDIAASRTIILETNRGCPYSCSFCYWGGATKSKVRPFPLARVKQEITHIVTHAPPHATIFLADANFGILPRDPEIAEWLVTELKRQGKRMFLFTNWAKNTNKRVLEAARILYSNQLISAVTLSAQSFTPEVLQIARRSNIRTSYYRQLQSDFQAMGVPTYTELIWGLPGETLATHLGSVEEAITSGGHPVVYPLLLLNNTEYTTASVRDEQELVTRVLPYQVSNPEMEAEFVVQHRAMPLADWRRGMAIRLALAVFHGCLLRSLLRYLHARMGVRVVDMLDLLVGFLGDGCPEPVVRRLAADHFESLLDPEALDTGLLGRYLPADCIPEHPHYQSIIRHLAASEGTGEFVAAAAAYLWNALRPETRPPADEYRTVVEYQQAIAAVLAASVRGVAATGRVALPAGLHEVLVEAGQVRPVTVANGTAHVDLDGAETARMPADALLLAVYHGSVHVPRSLQPAVAVA